VARFGVTGIPHGDAQRRGRASFLWIRPHAAIISPPSTVGNCWVLYLEARRRDRLRVLITDVYRQDRALAGLATVIAEAGDLDRAEALTRTITDPDHQAEALADLATPAAQAGAPERAVAGAISLAVIGSFQMDLPAHA
jgi:hypothetical protein